jgi:hypothetical protein
MKKDDSEMHARKRCPKCGKEYDCSWGVCLYCNVNLVGDGIQEEREKIPKLQSNQCLFNKQVVVVLWIIFSIAVGIFMFPDVTGRSFGERLFTKEDNIYHPDGGQQAVLVNVFTGEVKAVWWPRGWENVSGDRQKFFQRLYSLRRTIRMNPPRKLLPL